MARSYCVCGFVPAIDDHDCPVDKLIELQEEAEAAGDTAAAEEIEKEIEKWERE